MGAGGLTSMPFGPARWTLNRTTGVLKAQGYLFN